MGRFELVIASCSDVGRRAGNEDALRIGTAGDATFAILADGAGGHVHGAEAARRSVNCIESALRQAGRVDRPTLRAAVCAAHEDLGRRQRHARGRERMHATAVVLWIDGTRDRALWSHVGDSRLYRLRYGAVEILTKDDSVVQRLLDSGALTPRQAEIHPLRNQLLAALGMQGPLEPSGPAAPEPLLDGDAYLLCTDGWWGALAEADLAATWQQAETPADWLEAMRRLIGARGDPRQDNYSAIAVWVADGEESTRPQDGG